MESHDYVLKLPLQQMMLRKITVFLWNRLWWDSHYSVYMQQETLGNLVQKVKEKVIKLFLPASLREELMNLVLPIIEEVKRWEDYHSWLRPEMVAQTELYHLCWTSYGTVDYRKTAERLILLNQVDTICGYKLSCIYCFDDDIRSFWFKLPENHKKHFHETEAIEDFFLDRIRASAVTVWTYFLMGDTASLINQYENEHQVTFFELAFESAALSGNRAATEYFFQKLTVEERETSLLKVAHCVVEKRCEINIFPEDFPEQNLWNVICYLLSQMSVDEQIEVFKMHPFASLVCFLDFPWPDLFLKIAGHMWNFLSFEEYRCLLFVLSENRYVSAFNHGKIFKEFFMQSPSHYRNALLRDLPTNRIALSYCFLNLHIIYNILPSRRMDWFLILFWTSNFDCIKLVLRNALYADRENLILSKFGVELCRTLVQEEKWALLELFVGECAISSETKNRLKNRIMLKLGCNVKNRDKLRVRKKVLELIDISNFSEKVGCKRCLEESESEQPTKPKKQL